MSATYNIGDLLKASAVPNAHEVRDLQQIGAFAAGLYKRLLAGSSYVQSRPGSFSEQLSSRFANASSDKWAHTSALVDLLTAHWASAGTFNVADGYHHLDADRSLLALYEEENLQPSSQATEETVKARTRSLFGTKVAPKSVKTNIRQLSKLLKGGKDKALSFKDGGSMSPLALAAFESAGLPLLDQVADLNFGIARSGGDAAHNSDRAIQLDSLLVDGRTPALNAALMRAAALSEQKFSRFSAKTETVSSGLASSSLKARPVAQSRAYGLFDAADARYLSLEGNVQAQQAAQAQVESFAANQPSGLFSKESVLFREARLNPSKGESQGRLRLSSLVPQHGLVPLTWDNQVVGAQALLASRVVTTPIGDAIVREQRGAMWAPRTGMQVSGMSARSAFSSRQQQVYTALAQEALTSSPDSRRPPFFNGAFDVAKPSVTLSGDTQQPNARTGFDVRALTGLAALPGLAGPSLKHVFRSKLDLAADLPLGATLSAYEAFAGHNLTRVASQSDRSDHFSTIGAQTSSRRLRIADVGDGMVWVAGKTEAGQYVEPSLTPLSLIPAGRPAVQLPATLAYAATLASAQLPSTVDIATRLTQGKEPAQTGIVGNELTNQWRKPASLANLRMHLPQTSAVRAGVTANGMHFNAGVKDGGNTARSSSQPVVSDSSFIQQAAQSGLLNIVLTSGELHSSIQDGSLREVGARFSNDMSALGSRSIATNSSAEGLLRQAIAHSVRGSGYARLDSDKIFLRALSEGNQSLTTGDSNLASTQSFTGSAAVERVSMFDGPRATSKHSGARATLAGLKQTAPALYKSLAVAPMAVSSRELSELASLKKGEKKAAISEGGATSLVQASSAVTSDKFTSLTQALLLEASSDGVPSLSGLRSVLQRTTMTAREINDLNIVFSSLRQSGKLSSATLNELEPSLTHLTRKFLNVPTATHSNYEVQLSSGAELAKLSSLLAPRTEGVEIRSQASTSGYDSGIWGRAPQMIQAKTDISYSEKGGDGGPLNRGAETAEASQLGSALRARQDVSSLNKKTFEARAFAGLTAFSPSLKETVTQQIERNLARTWMGAAALGGDVGSKRALQALASAYSALPAASPILRTLAAQQQRIENVSSGTAIRAQAVKSPLNHAFANLGAEMRLLSQATLGSESLANKAALQELQISPSGSQKSVKTQAGAVTSLRAARSSNQSDATSHSPVTSNAHTGELVGVASAPEQMSVLARQLSGVTSAERVQTMMQRLNSIVERIGASKETEHLHSKLVSLMQLGDATAEPSQRTTMHALAFKDAERLMVSLERQATPSLEDRVAQTLAQASWGPAGARRLLAPKANLPAVSKGADTTRVKFNSPLQSTLEATLVTGEAIPTVGSKEVAAKSQQPTWAFDDISSATKLQLAALNEEREASSVALNQVIAPEIMMTGARSHVVRDVRAFISSANAKNKISGLNLLEFVKSKGLEFSAARETYVHLNNGSRQMLKMASPVLGVESDVSTERPEVNQLTSPVTRLNNSITSAYQMDLQRVAPQGRRGMLSTLLKQADRAELISLIEQSGAREFAEQWGARVDGSKTGLDLGYAIPKEELDKTFGRRRVSALAERSEFAQGQAHLLSSASPTSSISTNVDGVHSSQLRADRSGLRRVASELVASKAGASRPQHQAERAIRRTDWRFVETGSRAATPHADLGKLAAAVVSNSETSKRAPMPLVAPAVKAIAQTALRKSTTETESKPQTSSTSSTNNSAASGAQNQGQPKLTEQAIELLAVEMANRVARLMGLMKERIGVWA